MGERKIEAFSGLERGNEVLAHSPSPSDASHFPTSCMSLPRKEGVHSPEFFDLSLTFSLQKPYRERQWMAPAAAVPCGESTQQQKLSCGPGDII